MRGIDDEWLARAKLTDKQREALELWNPQSKGGGQHAIARALGITRASVQDRLRGALKRLAETAPQ